MKQSKLKLTGLLIALTALAAFCPAQLKERRVLIQNGQGTPHALWISSGPFAKFSAKWADADEDARAEMTDKAVTVLSDQFDKDLKDQEKTVKQLEKRLVKLKQQLDRRASKKDEIVKLRLQQLTMSWEGLGWNDSGPNQTGSRLKGLTTTNTYDRFFPNHDHEGNIARFQEQASGTARSFTVEIDDDKDLDLDEIRSAAGDNVAKIVSKYLDSVRELDAESANAALWGLVTEDDLELSDELWLEAAEIAEKAAGKIEVTRSPQSKANTLDTAAHLYHNGGDLDKAIKLQELAVELNPDSQLENFLRALKFTKKEKDIE